MNIVLIGFKSCGKSTTGKELAWRLGWTFVDLDEVIESLYHRTHAESATCRQIFQQQGEAGFRALESAALASLGERDRIVLATGGGAPLAVANRPLLRAVGRIVYLKASPEVLFARFQEKGMPAFLQAEPTLARLRAMWEERHPIYAELAEITLETAGSNPSRMAAQIARIVDGSAAQ